MPLLDRIPVIVDMREMVQPFAPQPVITQDNVTIAIDTVVYFQVTDAFRATYEVANFLLAMEQLAQTTLRNLVGAMTLEETLTSRDQINTQLRLGAGRGHREVGRPRHPSGAEEHRASANHPGGDGAADARRPGQAGHHPAGRG